MEDMKFERCGRCTKVIVGGRYALSRFDNESHICSGCGMDEAMWENLLPNVPLPPLSAGVAAYWTETGA